MYKSQYTKTNIREVIDYIDIKNYLAQFLESSYPYARKKVADMQEAMFIRSQMNNPENTKFKSVRGLDGRPFWYEQKVDFVKSNLRGEKGVIFYFLCNACRRRAKYLYFFAFTQEPLCRICCNITYTQPNRRQRLFSRLFNKQDLSTETKHMLIKKANITKEDIPDYSSDNCKNQP